MPKHINRGLGTQYQKNLPAQGFRDSTPGSADVASTSATSTQKFSLSRLSAEQKPVFRIFMADRRSELGLSILQEKDLITEDEHSMFKERCGTVDGSDWKGAYEKWQKSHPELTIGNGEAGQTSAGDQDGWTTV